MTFCPLADLFLGTRTGRHPVALRRGELRTWEDLREGAQRVALRVLAEGGERWVLGCEETWEFAAGLLGLLLAGRTPVLPPNFLPGTLERLRKDADGLLEALPAGPRHPFVEPVRLGGQLEFWTSGTTGEPKAVIKSLTQLDAEVALLQQVFGDPAGGPVAGTVPHHHIYGCLFRLLWPLAAGRVFLCEPCGEPATFLQAVAASPILISSPAHLSRLPRLLDFAELPALPSMVFSSGGPLARADALEWRRWVKEGVKEIYGSTESGGIAWRAQDEDPASGLWTPLPDASITLDPDGALRLQCFRAGAEPLRMEDAAEWAGDGRFRLLGRLDRTIKLEEKRVSLPEVEAFLETHPKVARAAVVLLEGRRPVLGAAVVLEGPVQDAPAVLGALLRRHLAQRFEPVALPRRWRFVASLPYNERGKLTPGALRSLFTPGPDQDALPARLLRREAEGAVFALDLDPGLEVLQGHFPGDPLLPGVIQVDWAVRLGREVFGDPGTFTGLENLKFLEPIRPGEPLELTLEREPGRIRFRFDSGARRKSSGTIRFQEIP